VLGKAGCGFDQRALAEAGAGFDEHRGTGPGKSAIDYVAKRRKLLLALDQ
jgi:hypothetical protein